MPGKVLIIYNPHADAGRALRDVLRLKSSYQSQLELTWVPTEYPKHAPLLAAQAAELGYEIVAAMGGDGTIHEVINGLMQLPRDQRPILAAIPIGSGNDFCVNVGLGMNSERAMERLLEGQPQPIDIGKLEDSTGNRVYWGNTLGIGFDAITLTYTKRYTYLRGSAMYFAAILQSIMRDHFASRMSIQTEDQAFEKDLLMLTVCNGSREGGGFWLVPEARMDDGILDFIMVEYVSRPMMFRLIPEFLTARHTRFQQVHVGHSSRLDIQSELPMVIHMDGEIYSYHSDEIHEVNVEILPGAIQLIF